MSTSDTFELPLSYGESFVTLLPRDPDWAYVFWEITPQEVGRSKEKLGEFGPAAQLVLRVYHAASAKHQERQRRNYFDVEAQSWLGGRYVLLGQPGSIDSVAVGYRTDNDVFVAVARSRPVRSPHCEPGRADGARFLKVVYESSESKKPLRVEAVPAESASR